MLREIVQAVEETFAVEKTFEERKASVHEILHGVNCRAGTISFGGGLEYESESPTSGWGCAILVLLPDERAVLCTAEGDLGTPEERMLGTGPLGREHNRQRRAMKAGCGSYGVVPFAESGSSSRDAWRVTHALAIGLTSLGIPTRLPDGSNIQWQLEDECLQLADAIGLRIHDQAGRMHRLRDAERLGFDTRKALYVAARRCSPLDRAAQATAVLRFALRECRDPDDVSDYVRSLGNRESEYDVDDAADFETPEDIATRHESEELGQPVEPTEHPPTLVEHLQMRTVTPMPRTLRRRRAKIAEARHQELVERWLATGMAKLVARTERAEIRALEDAGFSVLEACEREGRWWWIMVHEEALRAEDTLRGDPDGALATFDVERQVRQTLVNQIARAERLAPANAKRKLRRWLQDPSRYRAQTQRYRTAFDALCNLREHKRKGEAPGLQTTERGGPSS